jgi:hypothetical protein
MQKKKKMCAFGGHIGVQDISEEYSQLLWEGYVTQHSTERRMFV